MAKATERMNLFMGELTYGLKERPKMIGRWIKFEEWRRERLVDLSIPLCSAEDKAAWIARNPQQKDPVILAKKSGREDYGWRSLPIGSRYIGDGDD